MGALHIHSYLLISPHQDANKEQMLMPEILESTELTSLK